MTTYYKVTAEDGSSCNGGTGRWRKNRWRSVKGDLAACERGLHLVTRDQIMDWLGPAIWEAEVDGDVIDAGDKVVARRARVVRRLNTWNETTSRLFAADCAEHVLPIFEKVYPNDDRPRKAIGAARAFATGEMDDAAGDAAWAAARDAAWAAARAAARDAAGAAAWAAARDAAGDAAGDAAWDAAWAAAGAAAGAAAWAAAWAAERKWQVERLWQYLDGKVTA